MFRIYQILQKAFLSSLQMNGEKVKYQTLCSLHDNHASILVQCKLLIWLTFQVKQIRLLGAVTLSHKPGEILPYPALPYPLFLCFLFLHGIDHRLVCDLPLFLTCYLSPPSPSMLSRRAGTFACFVHCFPCSYNSAWHLALETTNTYLLNS